MTLETERLILRPWEEADAEVLYKYAKDPRVGPVAGWPVHTSEENSLQVLRNVLMNDKTFAVVVKSENEAVGSIGLMIGDSSNFALPENEGEIGYWIAVPYWGKGLIPEGCLEIMRYGFEELKLEKIWCGYFEGNVKSFRAGEKCGFKYSHTEKDRYWPLIDKTIDIHVSCLTKEEWAEKKIFI